MKKLFKLIALIFVSFVIWGGLSVTVLNAEQVKVAVIVIFAVVAWTFEILPSPVVSLTSIGLLVVFKVVDFETATSGFTNGIVWFLLGISILGYALEKSGIVSRLAKLVLVIGCRSISKTLLTIIGSVLIFTILVPTAVGRAGIVSVLTDEVIHLFGAKYEKVIAITATLAIFALQLTVLTGTGGALYVVAYLDAYEETSISYVYWFMIMLPPSIVMALILYFIVVWKFKLKDSKVEANIKPPVKKARINLMQWKVILISGLSLSIWISGSWIGIDIYAYTLLLIVILLLPGIGAVTWQEVKEIIPWGTFLIFGGALALGIAIRETDLASTLAIYLRNHINGEHPVLIIFSILMFFLLSRVTLVNLMSIMVTVVPIIMVIGPEIGWNPIWMILLGFITASAGYLVPAQSPVALLMLEKGHFSELDLKKFGIICIICWSIVMTLFAVFYWPLIGMDFRP